MLPAQSESTNVYTISPSQVGALGAAPATGVIAFPHASTTVGGVGDTAEEGHSPLHPEEVTVVVACGLKIVKVYVQVAVLPAQSV